MELRLTSIPPMLEYVSSLGDAPGDLAAVRRILDHPDYRFEARRYGLDSLDHVADYLSRLKVIDPSDIPDLSRDHRKNSLRDKHQLWLDCAARPEKYRDRLERVRSLFTEDFLAEMQGRLAAMFPAGTEMIEEPAVISTLSFGQSFGYPHEGAIHLDLFGVERYSTMEELPGIVLHEFHHLQMLKLRDGMRELTPLELYIHWFSGEGLAVKFCNNAEGVLSRRMEPEAEPNQGIPEIGTLNGHFEEHFRLFDDTIRRLAAGEMTAEDAERQMLDYWMNPYLYGPEMLLQTPVYSFGNELYGVVYDAFGLEELYRCVREPLELLRRFNEAGTGYRIEL